MEESRSTLLFGYFLPPNANQYESALRQVRLADELGLDLIGIQDHPYQSRFFDTWTLMSALAVQTSRIRFFADVANLPLRPPAVLAKSAASLDVMTGGRIEMGLGAGAFWQAIGAMGGPQRTPRAAVDALQEAIEIMRLMWSGERGIRFDGRYYQLKGVHSGPVPAHNIEIWLGAQGPRMLALTGRTADGWIPSASYVKPDQLPAMHEKIDEAAQQAGRSPTTVRRLYNLMGSITDGSNTAAPSQDFLNGPVNQWVDEILDLVTRYRMNGFIFAPAEPTGEQIRRFAAEVAPRVRASLK